MLTFLMITFFMILIVIFYIIRYIFISFYCYYIDIGFCFIIFDICHK